MKYKWTLFWIITGLCMLGTCGLAIIAYKSTPPTNSSVFIEVTKTIFLCLGGLGVILPLYINATNAIEGRLSEKIENTFGLIVQWDDPHLFFARKITREIKETRSAISDEELLRRIENDEELRQSVILVNNYLERVRFSIINNRIDINQFKSSIGAVIKDIINVFEPYFRKSGEQDMKDMKQLKNFLK